ncbi:MAG: hypothetical protein CM15mP120_14600 [Pseudomonadota bacterium]|nr:MAG: hypothetical protein CM15mP120_14600 [Pseudomonadota bacterium]
MTLTRNDLWSLEEYAGRREEFRKRTGAKKASASGPRPPRHAVF